jgi:hypothetical protein
MQLSSETQDELADIKDKVSSWTSSKTMADNPPAPGPSKRIIGPSRQPIVCDKQNLLLCQMIFLLVCLF